MKTCHCKPMRKRGIAAFRSVPRLRVVLIYIRRLT